MFADLKLYLKKILFLVGTDKRKLLLLLPLYLISSTADLVGIGLLVALISTLKDPDVLVQFASQIPFAGQYAVSSTANMLTVIFAGFVLLVYAIKTAISVYANWLTLKITFTYGAKLRSFLMGVYQNLSYDKFIRRNSSEYLHSIQAMVGQFVSHTVQPLLRIIGDSFVALLIMSYLAVKDPFVLAFLLILIAIASILYDRAYRHKIASYGSQENNLSAKMLKSITEGLNGYKESHIFGIVHFFHRNVSESAFKLANSRIRSQIITTSSRYLLEFIVVISVVCVIIATIALGRDKQALLTTVALFLVVSMRLVPAANQIVTNLGNLRYGRHAVEVLYRDVTEAGYVSRVEFDGSLAFPQELDSAAEHGTMFGRLELQNVSFRYQPEGPWLLNSIDLRIDRHDIVGIVGSSGSGKTTMIALILGLLKPQKGSVLCDGKDLALQQNVKEWHRKVAYLPQEVFLIDDTVDRNVALGVDDDTINEERLNAALAKAQLAEMVQKMPNGIKTHVGEKGSWISGGQRQRIALARAFYYDAAVLILDESTSALDAETADEIISELRQLKGKVTIVVITHQDVLLGLCNKVYQLGKGGISLLRHDIAELHKSQ